MESLVANRLLSLQRKRRHTATPPAVSVLSWQVRVGLASHLSPAVGSSSVGTHSSPSGVSLMSSAEYSIVPTSPTMCSICVPTFKWGELSCKMRPSSSNCQDHGAVERRCRRPSSEEALWGP